MRKEMLKKSIGTIVMTIALVGTSILGVTVNPVKVNADVATTVSASSNEVGKLESIFTTIDLMDASISELETAMEKGELTAEQLVQMYIDRINAYDTERTAAGSSGGTAVAITSNFATAGLGTDTGSSIRRPSSFSNLYGLRPSKGLTSIDGVVPLNGDRDVTGPICRSAEDLATIMTAIAGTDANDSYTVDANADSLKPANGYETEMPLGMSLFTSYGNEEKLIEIAYSYEQTAGESIRKQPSTVPALEDKNVDKFLDKLIDKTDSIDFSEYTVYPNGKLNVLLNKYAEATEVDRSDVYETYEATYDLAKAYDSLMNKLLANKKVTTPVTDKTPTANTSTVTTPTTETVSAPAKAKISKIKKAKKSMKIAIRKQAGVKGYQIKYSTSKKFVAKKTKAVTTSKATVTVKKINVKKTYYVKVRAYKLIDGKVTYGAYSKVKKVS